MNTPAPASASLKAKIITQAIAIVCFVVVPTGITLVVPFTDLAFQKTGAGTSVTVKRYALTFIPWQTRRIDNVKLLRADITGEGRYGHSREDRRKGRSGTYRYATGQLAIVSGGPEVVVQAAPELAEKIPARFDQFVASGSDGPVKVSLYASWRLSYILGGVLTGLAALYLFGALASVVSFLLKAVRPKKSSARV